MKRHYIYLHSRINGVPFYIGKGTGKRDKQIKSRTAAWHSIVKKDGLVISKLCTGLTERMAMLFEKKFIDLYGRRSLKTGPLINLKEGGEYVVSVKLTPAQQKKQKIAVGIAMRSPKHRIKMSERMKKFFSIPENRIKHIAKMKQVQNTYAAKKLLSKRMKKLWANPDYRKQQMAIFASKETKAKRSASMLKCAQTASFKANHTAAVTTPEYRAKMSITMKRVFAEKRKARICRP